MAVNTFGAVELNFAAGPLAGKVLDVEGAVTVENEGGGEVTVKSYKNGSISRSFNPMPVKIGLTFKRPAQGLPQDIFLGEHSIVIREVHLGKTHYLVNAVFSGTPSASMEDGGLSGLSLECAHADYRVEG